MFMGNLHIVEICLNVLRDGSSELEPCNYNNKWKLRSMTALLAAVVVVVLLQLLPVLRVVLSVARSWPQQ